MDLPTPPRRERSSRERAHINTCHLSFTVCPPGGSGLCPWSLPLPLPTWILRGNRLWGYVNVQEGVLQARLVGREQLGKGQKDRNLRGKDRSREAGEGSRAISGSLPSQNELKHRGVMQVGFPMSPNLASPLPITCPPQTAPLPHIPGTTDHMRTED
jgi:hypothetical protein